MNRTSNGILLPSGWGPSGKKFLAEGMSSVVLTASKNWGWGGMVSVHTLLLTGWAAFCLWDGQVLQSLRPVPTPARASQIQPLHNQKVSPKGKKGSKQEQKCRNLGALVHATWLIGSKDSGSLAFWWDCSCLLFWIYQFSTNVLFLLQ